MCLREVQKVTKMKERSNIIVLTFFGSSIKDYAKIGPLHLRAKPFVDLPLQCFGCYESQHGRKKCTKPTRCENCSKLNSHNINEYDTDSYCFHCRANHSLRSLECPRYRLEQDILHFANQNCISLGNARRELAYWQEQRGEAMSYAAFVGFRFSSQSTTLCKTSNRPLPAGNTRSSPTHSSAGVPVLNRFSTLNKANGVNTNQTSSAIVLLISVPTIRVNQGPSHKESKWHHSSTKSDELQEVPPQKRCITWPKWVHVPQNILPASVEDSVTSPVHSPNNCPEVPCAVGATDIDGIEDFPLINLVRQVS